MKNYTIILSENETAIMINALRKLPMEVVENVYANVMAQVQIQQKGQSDEKSED